ncbi:MAG: hypothetical protein AB7H90_19995 [Alphaproteobacteria bacterium]
MSSQRNFVDLCLAGEASVEEIDDFIDAWHDASTGKELHDYLGMTRDEYSLWLRAPDALPCILNARRNGEKLTQAVGRAYEAMRLAPSKNDTPTVARLRIWLKEKGVPV